MAVVPDHLDCSPRDSHSPAGGTPSIDPHSRCVAPVSVSAMLRKSYPRPSHLRSAVALDPPVLTNKREEMNLHCSYSTTARQIARHTDEQMHQL